MFRFRFEPEEQWLRKLWTLLPHGSFVLFKLKYNHWHRLTMTLKTFLLVIHLVFPLSYWTHRDCGKWFSGVEPHDQWPSLHSAQVHTFYFGRYTWFPEEVKYASKWRYWLLRKQDRTTRRKKVNRNWCLKRFPTISDSSVHHRANPYTVSLFMPIMVVSWNFSYNKTANAMFAS